ncbi:MAG: hypothetical protein AB7P76_04625 [Candidatus Melainabacteria bacterium]
MPRIPEKDRAALPKPILKQSALGLYPVNAATVSWLHQGLGEVIVEPNPVQPAEPAAQEGTPATPVVCSTITLSDAPPVAGAKPSKKTTTGSAEVSLEGRAFRGMSNVLYRGRLTQVVLAIPDGNGLNILIQEIMDHLYKIEAMGSLLTGDPVNSMVPCVVLLTPGVIYRVFMERLSQQLATLNMMPDGMIEAVKSRMLRGLLPAETYQSELMQTGRTLAYVARPAELKLAGGTGATRTLVASVLQMNGVKVSNMGMDAFQSVTAAAVSPERLELEHALQHLASRLPGEPVFEPAKPVSRTRPKKGMADPIRSDNAPADTAKDQRFAHPLLQSVMKLGRRLNVFQSGESCEDILGQSTLPMLTSPLKNSAPVDQLTLLGLAQMAHEMDMPDVRSLYHRAIEDLDP